MIGKHLILTPGILFMRERFINELDARFCRMLIDTFSRYDVISEYHLDKEEQIMLSDGQQPQRCRFCGRSHPEVTFNKVAHALSHMVENRHLKSDYECDECNLLFSRYENDYSAYMNLFHTMYGVRGKRGIPKYRLHSEAVSKITNQENTIYILLKEDEDSLIEWEEEDKKNSSIKIKAKRAYTPQNVLKAIIKMGLSVMPKQELPAFKTVMDWLMNKQVSGLIPKIIIRTYINKLAYTSCWILKRKDSVKKDCPKYMFILAYNGIVVQSPFPFVAEDEIFKDQTTTIPLFPTSLDKLGLPIRRETISVASIQKKYDEVVIGVKYGSVENTSPKTSSTAQNESD